jgi:SAM-dependent methyltransferase
MPEQPLDALRQKVISLVKESMALSAPYGWFDRLYSQAEGDASQVPWAKLTTHPYLQDWLDKFQPQGNNRPALVIGCGLGDDAETLAKVGYKVTAFDVSPKAIAWCKQRFPNSSVDYRVADLFALDSAWRGVFDLVFECRTIQALPLNLRVQTIEAIASTVAPEGTLLVISWMRDIEDEPDGPPWAVSNKEFAQFRQLGFQEVRRDLFEGSDRDITEVRIEMRKANN